MQEAEFTLAVIIGSNREGRRGHIVADWFRREAEISDRFNVSVIDLARLSVPGHFPDVPGGDIEWLLHQLRDAHAMVIVTPEYNHGYPASVKQAIDLTGEAWYAKPVGFVSYGGASGGIRAVEQLRQIIPELRAVSTRTSVSIPNFSDFIAGNDRFNPPTACVNASVAMLDELAWWCGVIQRGQRVSV